MDYIGKMSLYRHDTADSYMLRMFQQTSNDMCEESYTVVELTSPDRLTTQRAFTQLLRGSVHIYFDEIEEMKRSILIAGNFLCIESWEIDKGIIDCAYIVKNCRYPRPKP